MQPLHAVVVGHKLRGEIVEELLVGGGRTEDTEITGVAVESFAEMPRPDAVDSYAGEQRVVVAG